MCIQTIQKQVNMNAIIDSIGVYLPEKKIDNHYFEQFLETTDEWIVSRTGINTRYYSSETEYTSDLCVKAAQNLAANYQKNLADIDFVIVATSTPDQAFPSMASQVQSRLGIPNAGCMDVSAGCAGFAYGLILAKGLIATGDYQKVLVIGGETLSKISDFTDRTSCVLFGDGAGAVLVESSETQYLHKSISTTNGDLGKDLYLSNQPAPINFEQIDYNGKIHQNGRTVFKWAVSNLPANIIKLAEKNGITTDQIDWMIPHSANIRILEAACSQMDFPIEKCLESVVNYGNTSAASIPIAWYNGIQNGKVQLDDKLMLAGFGSGLTLAGIYLTNRIQKA